MVHGIHTDNKAYVVRSEVFTAVTMKKAVFLVVVLTNVSEERIASIFRVEGKKKIHKQRNSESRCKQTNVGNKFSYMRAGREGTGS
jgi:hypothetical protein